MNYWLILLACFLGGMTFKWVMDVFFLRHAYHENEQKLSQREAEFTTLKHEHSQTLTDLKNRLTELDATSKAKALAEANFAKQNSNLVSLRAHVLNVEGELATSRQREAELSELGAGRERELSDAVAQLATLQREGRDQVAVAESLRLRLAEASALVATEADAAAGLRGHSAMLQTEFEAATARLMELEAVLAAQQSVASALEAAVSSRDAQIADCQSRFATLEAERQSVATSLGVADRELASERTQVEALSRKLEELIQKGDGREVDLRMVRNQLEGANKARLSAEALVKTRDGEIAHWEKRATELQQLADATARENRELRAELTAAKSERPKSGVTISGPDPAFIHRIQDIEAELLAVSNSHARLEAELVEQRRKYVELELAFPTHRPGSEVSASSGSTPAGDAPLLSEIEELTRERNALAAELAGWKSTHPQPTASARKKKVRNPGVELFPVPTTVPAAAAESHGGELKPADGPDAEEAVSEYSIKCPQHLSEVKGVGPVFEQRLYGAGVGSYWELSQLSDRTLTEVLELDEQHRQQFDFSGTRADAARLAHETRSVGRKWTGEPPDDLEPLSGIGSAVEKRLYEAGICTYASLAAASVELLEEICPAAKFHGADYALWIQQARQRLGGEET